MSSSVEQFPRIIERGCGLDVHRETVVARIKGKDIRETTKTFGNFTGELQARRLSKKSHTLPDAAFRLDV